MYADREAYYKHLISIYSRYIPKLVIGRYKGALIFIDTDNRMVYNTRGHRGRLNGTMQRLSEERAGRV